MRIIIKLDIKQNDLIKSIRFDGVRKIDPIKKVIKKYQKYNIDEVIVLNSTGSLYNTKINVNLLKEINKSFNIPIAAGGGIKLLNDAKNLIHNGCEKIILNTLFHENIEEAKKIIKTFGSASVIGSIQYKKVKNNFETFHTMSRVNTKYRLFDLINFLEDLGIGEILLNNIDNDGKLNGIDEDIELIDMVNKKNNIPFLVNGGFNSFEQLLKYKNLFSGIVISSALHFGKINNVDINKFKSTI